MAVNSSEKVFLLFPEHSESGQDDYSIAVLPDEGTTIRQCESHLSFLSLLEVPKPLKYSISLDAVLNSQNKVNLEMENTDAYCLCIADMDIEKGKSETPKTNDEPARKNEDPLARTLQSQRHINVQMGGNFMQLLMDHSLLLPKFNFRDKSGPERIHDTPNSRPRKYKRSASFNSRKVVFLFSILSSVGTLILIYLTLRVRQMANVSVHDEHFFPLGMLIHPFIVREHELPIQLSSDFDVNINSGVTTMTSFGVLCH